MNEKTKENKNRSTTCITLNEHELNSSRYSIPKTIYLLYLQLRKGLIAEEAGVEADVMLQPTAGPQCGEVSKY